MEMEFVCDCTSACKIHPDILNETAKKIIESTNLPKCNGWIKFERMFKSKQEIILQHYLEQIGVFDAYLLYENHYDSSKKLQIIPTSWSTCKIGEPSHPGIIVDKFDDNKPLTYDNIKEAKLGLYF